MKPALSIAAPAVAIVALIGCGSAHTTFVKVPPVATTALGTALQRLQQAGLRVQLTDFGPLPRGYGLEGAAVGDQDPEAPTRVRAGSVVRLNMHGVNPIPSSGFPVHHSKYVVVPKLVGLRWPDAEKRLSTGYWIKIGHVRAMSARPAADVLRSYVVTGERPSAGTRLPYAGVLHPRGGFTPTVVKLSIGVR